MPQRALDPGDTSVAVSCRVPKAVKETYRRKAKQSGLTLSEWVRETLDGGVIGPRGSVTKIAPPEKPKPAHEHVRDHDVMRGDTGYPVCRCGALQVDGRWV